MPHDLGPRTVVETRVGSAAFGTRSDDRPAIVPAAVGIDTVPVEVTP